MAAAAAPPPDSPAIVPRVWPVHHAWEGAPDERDAVIAWLRAEFAAANAIVDSLLFHLRFVDGNVTDYDAVDAALYQRRMHWTSIIQLQPFFSVTGVQIALQQAARARRPMNPPRRQPAGFRNYATSTSTSPHNGIEARRPKNASGQSENAKNRESSSEAANNSDNSAEKTGIVSLSTVKSVPQIEDAKPSLTPTEFLYNGVVNGKKVNVFEGLKLYEGLFESVDVNKLSSWVNEARISVRQGCFGGHSILLNKRPMKGHGREVIQLGQPIINGPPDESSAAHFRAQKVELIPNFISDVFDNLIQQEILPSKPDFCVVDFFYEGEHSHPLIWPSWYGTAVGTLCLTDCEMLFGRTILNDTKGFHKGPLKLSLPTGALLVQQGRSLELAKRAIPSIHRQRILLTFGKSQPLKSPSEVPRAVPSAVQPYVYSAPASVRASLAQHPLSPMNFEFVRASGAAPIRPPSFDGAQPLIIAANLSPSAMPFPAPVPLGNTSTAWRGDAPSTAIAPQSSSLPPGTGVFLPPSSASSSQHVPGTVNGGNASPLASPTKKPEASSSKLHCNGSSNGDAGIAEKTSSYKEQHNGNLAKEAAADGHPAAFGAA